MRARRGAANIFPTGWLVSVLWRPSGARRGLRQERGGGAGRSERRREYKSRRELLEKRVRLYTWRRTRLADEVGSDAMPDAAGGEGGHGAAKPEGVIHRNRETPYLKYTSP
jgi:hypothetical protein